jgi:flagellar hook protein FlgE
MATRSMLAAVSGIDANQTLLDEIANNIANAGTIGYKEGTVQFSDLLAEEISGATAPTAGSGGVNPVAVGSGVRVQAIITDMSEGTLEATGTPTDVAITGNGYLVVEDGGQQLYTRDGALTVDAAGNLTTVGGGIVQGWQASATGIINDNAPVGALSIPTGETIGAELTSRITLEGNLPAWNGTGTKPSSVTRTVDTYNALGTVVPIVFTFTPTKANVWKVSATVTEKTTTKTGTKTVTSVKPVDLLKTTVTVTFDPTTGELTGKASTALKQTGTGGYTLALTVPPGYPKTATLTVFFPSSKSENAVTQFSGAETLTATQNGYPSGALESYSISSTGVITGEFSNGQSMALGQIAMATFANASGLENVGNGLLTTSANSGQAQVGAPGTGVRGALRGGELEESNVNLGTQLTDLITAQEAYEANTKAISTSQQVVQSLEQV